MNDLVKNIDLETVLEAEAIMAKLPQLELKVDHLFSEGVYARVLHIPKGVRLTGHIHKYRNLNILLKGKIKVLVDVTMKEIEAPFVVVSPPGTKRIALALEDCIWITIHGTNETNLDLIDKKFIAHTPQEYLEFVGNEQLALPEF